MLPEEGVGRPNEGTLGQGKDGLPKARPLTQAEAIEQAVIRTVEASPGINMTNLIYTVKMTERGWTQEKVRSAIKKLHNAARLVMLKGAGKAKRLYIAGETDDRGTPTGRACSGLHQYPRPEARAGFQATDPPGNGWPERAEERGEPRGGHAAGGDGGGCGGDDEEAERGAKEGDR